VRYFDQRSLGDGNASRESVALSEHSWVPRQDNKEEPKVCPEVQKSVLVHASQEEKLAEEFLGRQWTC